MQQDRTASPLIPALLGIASAVLLGGAGFGLGCLYAGVLGPAPEPPVTMLATSPAATPITSVATNTTAPMPASEPGVGGPEVAVLPAALVTTIPAVRSRPLDMDRPVAGGWVSSNFGQRLDPFTGQPAVHRGLDFAGVDNSAILAVAPGVVTWSGLRQGYGNLIEIDHGRGWVTRYGHNASNLVIAGDYVKPGQTIGLMGSTGRATGTHLHFEVLYRGRHQNPARFVPQAT